MRKIVLIVVSILLCGCSSQLEINEKIKEIKYDNVIILKEDYDKIIKTIEKIKFQNGNQNTNANDLIVTTNNEIYYFEVSDLYLVYENKYAKTSELKKELDKLKKEYTNKDYYSIKYLEDYSIKEENTNILLDNKKQYIIIEAKESLLNLKINEIDYNSGVFNDINLLYQKERTNKKVIIRADIKEDIPKIRISFTNKYGTKVSIIPNYIKNKNTIEFDIN